MPIGPGKYDYLATLVREDTKAAAVMVAVIDGRLGHGFAVQTMTLPNAALLAELLHMIADQIEEDLRGKTN